MNDVGGYLEAIAAIFTILAFFGITNIKEFKKNGPLPISRKQRRLLVIVIFAMLFWWVMLHPVPKWLGIQPGVEQAGMPLRQAGENRKIPEQKERLPDNKQGSLNEAEKALKEAEKAWQELDKR